MEDSKKSSKKKKKSEPVGFALVKMKESSSKNGTGTVNSKINKDSMTNITPPEMHSNTNESKLEKVSEISKKVVINDFNKRSTSNQEKLPQKSPSYDRKKTLNQNYGNRIQED